MKVSFVIPNFNGEQIVKKNLPRVMAAAGCYAKDDKHRVEIIVVDDWSSDNSISVINQIFHKTDLPFMSMKLLQNPMNKGFSSTVNRGAKEASGEILILLNTDVYPEKNEDFFSKALIHFDDPKLFAVGFMDKSIEDDGKIVLRGRGIGRWKRGFLLHRRGEVDKTNTLWVSGGSSALRRSIWERLGGLNELYNPFYWEDIDLSYRALKCGYKIIFEPKCVVMHEHEKGSIKKSRSSYEIKTISYRNQLLFVWLNVTDQAIFFAHIFWLPYHILNTLMRGDTAFLAGLIKASLRIPQVLKKRVFLKNFLIGDSAVVSEFSGETIS